MVQNPPSNIILTGYRATGKSSIGKLLATRFSFNFVDMDKVIEQREGQTINAMVTNNGWPFFREKEQQLLEELITNHNQIISTGGGAILHQDTWPEVMSAGVVVWLTADQKTICKRLISDQNTANQRPSLTDSDTFAEVAAVLKEREPLYKKGCHLSVATDMKSLQQIASDIEAAIYQKT